MKKTVALIVVVDFLAAVVLVQAAIIARATIEKRPPHVRTYGQYAVMVTWPGDREDDVDVYVRDPDGGTAWYSSPETGILHLEHDDVGIGGSGFKGAPNFERVILRETAAGEFIVNVHLYQHRSLSDVPVAVELWRLKGADRRLLQQKLKLRRNGDEQTAFRFTLNAAGDMVDSNRLPTSLLVSSP